MPRLIRKVMMLSFLRAVFLQEMDNVTIVLSKSEGPTTEKDHNDTMYEPIVSSNNDSKACTNFSNYEKPSQDPDKPKNVEDSVPSDAFFESIVYNPNGREARSRFTSSPHNNNKFRNWENVINNPYDYIGAAPTNQRSDAEILRFGNPTISSRAESSPRYNVEHQLEKPVREEEEEEEEEEDIESENLTDDYDDDTRESENSSADLESEDGASDNEGQIDSFDDEEIESEIGNLAENIEDEEDRDNESERESNEELDNEDLYNDILMKIETLLRRTRVKNGVRENYLKSESTFQRYIFDRPTNADSTRNDSIGPDDKSIEN